MIDYTKGCQQAENEQPSEPDTAKRQRQSCAAGLTKLPYAIIWKDGKEFELY